MRTQEVWRGEADDALWLAGAARRHGRLREQLIDRYRYLAYAILRRMGRRWDEDLEQVALVGLVKAVDRFDPTSGNQFASFAVPTIVGEVKRYLRDQSRVLRAPRPVLDLHVRVLKQERELTAKLGRSPTVEELAATLGVEWEQVAEAMALEDICHPRSLDRLTESAGEEPPSALQDFLGEEDPALERIEDRIAWQQVLDGLDPCLRRVIELRYYRHLTQQEAARQMGVSQMQVSRLERRALKELRCQVAVA